MHDLVIPFRKKGQFIGFAASSDADFVIKPSKYEAWVLPLDNLKKNLRLMVKNKEAKMITAGDTEAVHVPKQYAHKIFL